MLPPGPTRPDETHPPPSRSSRDELHAIAWWWRLVAQVLAFAGIVGVCLVMSAPPFGLAAAAGFGFLSLVARTVAVLVLVVAERDN